MRKIKSNFFISLDGVVESPDKWHFPYFNDEMGAAVGAGFRHRRRLADGPSALRRVGRILARACRRAVRRRHELDQEVRRLRQPRAAEWQNSELISGNVATQKLTDIKAQEGGDIAMSGSPTTVRWLLREGSSTSSTCSCTRSLSATAWLASFRRTSRACPSSS